MSFASNSTLRLMPNQRRIGSAPTKFWPPPWIGMQVTGAPVTNFDTCLPLRLNVTLWPLLVLPT